MENLVEEETFWKNKRVIMHMITEIIEQRFLNPTTDSIILFASSLFFITLTITYRFKPSNVKKVNIETKLSTI